MDGLPNRNRRNAHRTNIIINVSMNARNLVEGVKSLMPNATPREKETKFTKINIDAFMYIEKVFREVL